MRPIATMPHTEQIKAAGLKAGALVVGVAAADS